MKRINKQVIVFAFGLLAFILMLGIVGNQEHNEAVIQSMGNEVYYMIHDKLGDSCSSADVVDEYMSNREYYDRVKNLSWE